MAFIAFLTKLISKLDEKDNMWRDKYTFCFDNAKIHKKEAVLNFLAAQEVEFLIAGVASFYILPVEGAFSIIKQNFAHFHEEQMVRNRGGLGTNEKKEFMYQTNAKLIEKSINKIDKFSIRKLFVMRLRRVKQFLAGIPYGAS